LGIGGQRRGLKRQVAKSAKGRLRERRVERFEIGGRRRGLKRQAAKSAKRRIRERRLGDWR
jgi:hypothetical protein